MPRRSDLYSFSPQERSTLANLILSFLNDAVVRNHTTITHSNIHLFTGHRSYIESLERFLIDRGANQFVPLPKWNPATPIPSEFNVVKPDNGGSARPSLQNLNPNRSMLSQFASPAVCSYTDGNALGNAANPWHGEVHGAVGGTMADFETAPAAPIFWCWHAFVDEIYYDWERCPLLIAGDPMGYMSNAARVVYRGQDGHLHELGLTDQWYQFDMTGVPGAVPPIGDPMGYFWQVPRVVYRGQDGHLHELAIYPETGAWGDFDMTGVPGAVPPIGDPMGYAGGVVPRVVYRGQDGHLHELAIYPETGAWGDFDRPRPAEWWI